MKREGARSVKAESRLSRILLSAKNHFLKERPVKKLGGTTFAGI
jgi:hypothetical protein